MLTIFDIDVSPLTAGPTSRSGQLSSDSYAVCQRIGDNIVVVPDNIPAVDSHLAAVTR